MAGGRRKNPPARTADKPETPVPARKPRIDLGIAILLFLATCALYSPVRQHAFLNYDDPDYVTANLHVREGLTADSVQWALRSTEGANWFPLTWISHMLDVQFFGMRSGFHHLTSVFLHAVGVVLLFLLLLRMTGALWRSVFVALVFALHPSHVESVGWIAERKDVLSALFWFVALFAYVRYAERRTAGRYALVLAAFGCGLMAKPMIVTLPVAALLLDVWPLSRAINRAVILEKAPLLALAAAGSIVTYLAQQGGGAVLSIGQVPLLLRIANALVSYVVYLGELAWPSKLAVFYPFPAGVPGWQVTAAGLALVLTTAFSIRERTRRPWLFVGWLWYLVTLLPVIGLVQVGLQARADRYLHIPSIGIAIVVAWGATEIAQLRPWGRTALAVATAGLSIAWCAATWSYLQSWHDSAALFRRAIAATRGNYIAHNNLGAALRSEGRMDEAIANFQLAIEIQPFSADAQNNLAEALLAKGQVEEATPHLAEALRLRPSFADAHVNLAAVLARRGRIDEAAAHYREALQLNPASAEAHAGLGNMRMEQGRAEEALASLREAIRIKPDYPDAHYNLGRVLGMLGRPAEATTEFAEVIRRRPGDAEAHLNLGLALAAQQRLGDAIDEFQAAVRLKPDYVNARFNLGTAFAASERYEEAIREFSEALRLQPDFAQARQSLEQCRELQRTAK